MHQRSSNRSAAGLGFCSLLLTLSAGADAATLEARAVLAADTFARGTTSGQFIAPTNGRTPPFIDKQPVQGFSAVLKNSDGTFLAMADNGFGAIENSADFTLRVYRIRPEFKRSKSIQVLDFFELRDPDRKIPFAITNHFSRGRVLTGADFDIESLQRVPDGSLYFGDEFGPFLLHTDATGKLLEAPIPLPDFNHRGQQIRAPQNPFNEESSPLRIMNAVRAHAAANHARTDLVISPDNSLLVDNNPATGVDSRTAPPAGSGVRTAASEIFNVSLLKSAGYKVVPYTVNEKPRMLELMRLGVNGLISDRPDLLREAVQEFDADNDGVAGDFLSSDGLIDSSKFDAQGHRGGRNLRPENTLPAMEAALDNLMSTLETDTGITADGIPVLSHDPSVLSQKCRRSSGGTYEPADEVLIKDQSFDQLQAEFICDRVFRGPAQLNDAALSPVSAAFVASRGIPNLYSIPSTQQLFDFVDFYADFQRSQPTATAQLRARNAAKVRFNIETKVNPRAEFRDRTIGAARFARTLIRVINDNQMQARTDVQSFDFRTLLEIHRRAPAIRTVFLFGDFPIFTDRTLPDSDDGTNLQDEHGSNTPWLAGLRWPYRVTSQSAPFRAATSGGFEGMAIAPDGRYLYPLLERPLAGDDPRTLLIHEYSLRTKRYTGNAFSYPLDVRGTNIGDFILFNDRSGLIIERDGTQGDLNGFKKIFQVALGRPGQAVRKRELVDLLRLRDPRRLSLPGQPGDVGLGTTFAFAFTTIEDIVVIDADTLGVINDNNYPFSVGRHLGTRQPDDSEFILIRLDESLQLSKNR